DVTSHGFSAALIMALVMAASGIHAEAAETPTEVLRRLEESLTEELANTEMFLTVFYAVVDPQAGRITFANAGHPHAFLVSPRTGEATRLEATRPPLGLATAPGADTTQPWIHKDAILCLFTDGVTEALGGRGEGAGGWSCHGGARAPGREGARGGEGSTARQRLRIEDCGLRSGQSSGRRWGRAAAGLAYASRDPLCKSAIRNPQSAIQSRRQHPL